MDKEQLDILIKAGLALLAVWTLFYKRTEVLGLAQKEYTAKLDSTARFFEKFYKNENENKLTLDRSAQELTRSDYVDYDLIVYLLDLNEKRLVNFDKIIRLYKHGRKFLTYTSCESVNSSCFELKIKKDRTVRNQVIRWNITYVVMAFLFFLPFIFFGGKTYNLLIENMNIIVAIYVLAYFLGTAVIAVSSLVKTTDLRDADIFLKEIKDADQKLKQINEALILDNKD